MGRSRQYPICYFPENNASVGLRVRNIRRASHMTQEKLADVLDVSVNYLGEIERGRKPLSRPLADHFCDYFHVTYDYLYHGITPSHWYSVRENGTYESVRSSLMEKIRHCTPEETVVIYQLVNSYLEISRELQDKPSEKNTGDGQENSQPECRPPEPT